MKMSELYISEPLPGLSLCTASMNRTKNLLSSLESWLKFPEINEIIIIDWSSEKPLIDSLTHIDDNRIKIFRVEGQINYSCSKANNLAVNLARYDRILRIDADVIINKGFFENHRYRKGKYWSGNWKDVENKSDKHLNGTLLFRKEEFQQINGYDERVIKYGWEDEEFLNRLVQRGLTRESFDYRYLTHQDHYQRTHNNLDNEYDEEFDNILSMVNIERNRQLTFKAKV